MIPIVALHAAARTKRWHTHETIRSQNLADHSWGVAMTVAAISPNWSRGLMFAALTHDLHETELGDIPYPAKRSYPALKDISDNQQLHYEKSNGIHVTLTREEEAILKWADMYELYLWVRQEYAMGNIAMDRVRTTALSVLTESAPNQLALNLLGVVK